MEQVDLDEVLQRARRRDPDALSTLVDLYSPRVFGLLYRLSGSRDVAEELMQETFLRLVRTIERYEHSGKFEAWLFRIAANLARDRARRRQRRGPLLSFDSFGDDETAEPPAQTTSDQSPSWHLMQKEAGERVAAGLQQLNPPEREILMLRHYSGLSFKEIAEILDVPLGTALARAHRALNRLKTDLGQDV
ncbi:MAG: RNA polymerase sigma factor [Planctomycetota bacterium]